MIWKIFKEPYKKGALPIATYHFEPNDLIITTLAATHGPITAISQEELDLKK